MATSARKFYGDEMLRHCQTTEFVPLLLTEEGNHEFSTDLLPSLSMALSLYMHVKKMPTSKIVQGITTFWSNSFRSCQKDVQRIKQSGGSFLHWSHTNKHYVLIYFDIDNPDALVLDGIDTNPYSYE
jgi:hypothetical protein